jgi:hypothetical protein
LSFGTSLTGTPTVTDVGVTGLNVPAGMDLVRDGSNNYAVISNYGSTTLTVVNFGSSITNAPVSVFQSTALTEGSNIVGVSLLKECDTWYGLLSSGGNNKILKLSFGSNLLSQPVVSSLGTISGGISTQLVVEGNSYGFVTSTRLNLGIVLGTQLQ